MAYGTTSSRPISSFGRWGASPPEEGHPALWGSGPAECSSCTELSVVPDYIFDVNGYYRELGVHPKATRKELRQAYQAKGGQSSARLTYIFRQLLNPQTRFAYDCTPLGEVFMDDYIRDRLNNAMRIRLYDRMADLAQQGVDMDSLDDSSMARDIYSEMGFDIDGDTPVEVVDSPPPSGEDDPRPAKFEYAYYMWATHLREDPEVQSRMAHWQRVLVSAFSREGVRIKFAVGLHGKPNRWIQALVGYRTVFFLNREEEPTEALARDVALQVRLDRSAQPLAITER